MKINVNKLWVGTITAMACGVFLVLPVSLDTWRTILTFLILLFILYYFIKYPLINIKNNFLKSLIFFWGLIMSFEIYKASKEYGYSMFEVFYSLRHYIWIVLAIPLSKLLKHETKFDEYFSLILKIILISLTIRAMTWFVFTYLNIEIFPDLLYEFGISWTRNGSQRIDATALYSLLIPGLFYFYSKTKQKRYITEIILCFLYVIFVTQTRMIILCTIGSVFITLFFKKRKSNLKFVFQAMLIMVFVLAMSCGLMDQIFQYLDLTNDPTSLGYRYYEYKYYSGLLQNDLWKTGLGILSSINENSGRLLFGNLDTKMFLGDLGFFECFLQFGLLSFILYGGLYVYGIKAIVNSLKCKMNIYSELLIGILSYVFLLSFTMNLYGEQKCASVPYILVIIAFVDNIARENKTIKLL